jgi:hypothetical protein
MPDGFKYDVFLSHSAKDKAVVRPLAKQLRKDGLRVSFDEWMLMPSHNVPAKIDEGLEYSRVLVLCMSASSFGADRPQSEAGTFRFHDPLNKERRLIPLRLGFSESERGELGCSRTQWWVRQQVGSARCCRAETILNRPRPFRQLRDCLGSRGPTDSP